MLEQTEKVEYNAIGYQYLGTEQKIVEEVVINWWHEDSVVMHWKKNKECEEAGYQQ